MTTFGLDKNRVDTIHEALRTKEHGVGLKLATLRLGKTALILSRANNRVTLALIS